MNSHLESLLAEAKKLSLTQAEKAHVRQVLVVQQAANESLALDPLDKAAFRRRLKESMGKKPEPWWQLLLQLPQLSLPAAGLAVFLLVFATGGVTSLRWLTDESTLRAPVAPAGLGAPDTQHMVPDDFLQMPDKKSDEEISLPQEPAANEPAAEHVLPIMPYRAGFEEAGAGAPAMEALEADEQALPAEPSAAESILPNALRMMVEPRGFKKTDVEPRTGCGSTASSSKQASQPSEALPVPLPTPAASTPSTPPADVVPVPVPVPVPAVSLPADPLPVVPPSKLGL